MAMGLHAVDLVQSRSNVPVDKSLITLQVGPEKHLFSVHQNLLLTVQFFRGALLPTARTTTTTPPSSAPGAICPPAASGYAPSSLPSSATPAAAAHSPPIVARFLELPHESPLVFSCVLEFLLYGDYCCPRELLPGDPGFVETQEVWMEDVRRERDARDTVAAALNLCPDMSKKRVVRDPQGQDVLRDAMVYCAAEKYGIKGLKRIALRKLREQPALPCHIILSSARYAYAHTAENDPKLRAFFVSVIVRNHHSFARSNSMRRNMLAGGTNLFFDLFVAMNTSIDGKDAQAPVQ
ncbi:hypothetical protein TD95_000027 [Thielaviopsis punctulata]|uniref:BTB domain-containing protein n=1 Tax=Thielaviopsis punctulata TaxID=72032 RepID=A0A0F4Z6Z4_9PEZI|nr:hypothetical protein TD95_000027 [Thielaviopsis punctulata]